MRKYFYNFIFIILTIATLSSCSTAHKLKRQNKKYDKLSSGIRYNTYRAASKASVAKVVKEYNKVDTVNHITDADVHSYFGFLMLVANQNRFAAAEADMILRSESNIMNEYSAQNIIAGVKHNKEWELSAVENEFEASKIEESNPDIDSVSFSYYSSELVQAYLHLQKHDFVGAAADFTRLSPITGYEWPAHISHMLASIQNGDSDIAQSQYESLLIDEEVPSQVKKWLRKNVPEIIEDPEKLNEIDSSISKMIRIYINSKFTVGTVKAASDACMKMAIGIMGNIK